MTGNKIVDRIYRALEIFVKVSALNGMWMVFTLMGAGVLGFFPASAALLSVVRKWIMEGFDAPASRTFIACYKKEFGKANLFGYAALIYAAVLYTNYQYMLMADGVIQLLFVIGLIILGTLFFLTVTFLFPVIVHFDLPVWRYVKVAFQFGLRYFYLALFAGLGFMVIYHVVLFLPSVFMWFIPSLIGLTLMNAAYLAFHRFSIKPANSF
ncbi:hypothetical protein GCM10010954_38920 [Halobacillus andaensis]|uniref:DUF624 domain-containing protein n=1 Tax=Halobacillus andaensis TaxID=1176239 RepID=A0A917BFD7_HALAA|nr:DUF624 domain-containing protein [Halobacillus andaensis]MBP2006721.1 putative membrane protein YesL [Halobacillus andaensis]GGF36152.1 hypothetical protein GCM10010954_38920 [Halobacillus andaensis]